MTKIMLYYHIGKVTFFFSSPELAQVNFCHGLSSVMRRQHLACEHSRGHSFSRIFMKPGQDDCLDKISDEIEIGSHGVKN